MPAQTATTENSDLQRAVAFERRAHEQAARHVERLPYGFTFLDERLPLVFYANLIWVTAAADDAISAAQLIADADRQMADYTHRWAVVEHKPLWRALDDDLAAAGWGSETHVYMTHPRAPDRLPECSGVREVGHDGILAAERRFTETQPWCTDPEAGRQVIEHHRRIGELLGERCFAAYAGDEVCAYARLRHVDGVAQIEDVVVLAEHRGAGLGRLVTSAALAAAIELEPELLFIVADDDDWPKELYGRLGFVPVGRVRAYHRLPPP